MAHRFILSLVVVLALSGAVFGARRGRPAETAEMSIDTSVEHNTASNLRVLHNSLVNGRHLKGIKIAEVERQMRNYDDLREELALAQEGERSWLANNGEVFEQPSNAAVNFFEEVNKAVKEGEMNDQLANTLVASTKLKREEIRQVQTDALKELEQTQAKTRGAAVALNSHLKQMAALLEKSKHAEVERHHEEQTAEKVERVEKAEKQHDEKTAEKVEPVKKAEKRSEEQTTEKVERVEKAEQTAEKVEPVKKAEKKQKKSEKKAETRAE